MRSTKIIIRDYKTGNPLEEFVYNTNFEIDNKIT